MDTLIFLILTKRTDSMADEPKKRGRPKGSYSKKITQAEGVAYVYLSGNSLEVAWENPEITISTMEKLRANEEAESLQLNLSNLIFPAEPPMITVIDPDEQDKDEVAARLRQMCDRPEVAFYKQMKNYLIDSCYSCYFYSLGISQASDGFIELIELRDLPSASFNYAWNLSGTEKGRSVLFPGVVLQDDGKIHYYQTGEDGQPHELKNCSHMKPPGRDSDICGRPLFYSLVPVFNRSKFSWLALMQTVNRAGAPSVIMKIENPTQKDFDLAKKILKNYSKNNQFTIPGNFTPIEIGKNPNDIALKAIEATNNIFSTHFSPARFIASDGNIIGGSDQAKADLLLQFIMGFQQVIVDNFKPILQDILTYNGYTDYKVSIVFPKPEFKDGTLDYNRAKDAAEKGAIDPNEYRVKMGFEPMTNEDLSKLPKKWNAVKPIAIDTYNTEIKGNEPDKEAALSEEDVQAQEENKKKTEKDDLQTNQAEDIIEETAAGLKDGWDELINGFQKYLEKKVTT